MPLCSWAGRGTWRADLDLPRIRKQDLTDLTKLIFENALGYDVFVTKCYTYVLTAPKCVRHLSPLFRGVYNAYFLW